jgi:hypothetical protein
MAQLLEVDGTVLGEMDIKSEEEAQALAARVQGASFKVGFTYTVSTGGNVYV